MKVIFTEEQPFKARFGQPDRTGFKDVIKGQDGISPTVDVQKVDNETTITITDVNGSHVAKILDGRVADVPIDNRTLVLDKGKLKVNTTDDAEKDNTLPITSAGAYVILGNLESFMSTI